MTVKSGNINIVERDEPKRLSSKKKKIMSLNVNFYVDA